ALMRPATAAAVIALALALLVGGAPGRVLAALAAAGGVAGLAMGRMGPHSGAAVALLGTALLLLDRDVAEILAAGAAASSLLALVSQLYGGASSQPMSAALLLILAGGTLCARPARGWMAAITRAGPGARMARRLLPAALLLPIGLGSMRVAGEA